MKQEELNKILEEHKLWLETRFTNDIKGTRADLSYANIRGANIRGANLSDANLSDANLSDANLDYSCLPLWCGSLKANFDDRVTTQILYHLLSIAKNSNNISQELKDILLTDRLINQANKFHRVDECGKIEREGE